MCKLESYQVAKLVRCRINLKDAKLHKAYYPAHLSVALIDAIFNPQLRYEKQVVPIIKRYCRYFGIPWTRAGEDRRNLPLVVDEETLTNLIIHYKKYGVERMMNCVFQSRFCSPGTKIRKAKNVYRAALALQRIGIDNLQDAESTSPKPVPRSASFVVKKGSKRRCRVVSSTPTPLSSTSITTASFSA